MPSAHDAAGDEVSALQRLSVILLVLVLFASLVVSRAAYAGAPPAAPAQQQQPIANNDDTRVRVQLIVLGAAIVAVIGIGGAS